MHKKLVLHGGNTVSFALFYRKKEGQKNLLVFLILSRFTVFYANWEILAYRSFLTYTHFPDKVQRLLLNKLKKAFEDHKEFDALLIDLTTTFDLLILDLLIVVLYFHDILLSSLRLLRDFLKKRNSW